MVFWQQKKVQMYGRMSAYPAIKRQGTYNVHVYGVVNGQQINLGQTTFEVSSPKENK